MGCGSSTPLTATNQINGANGPLRKGVRVQTQWDEGAGHDNKWYCGTIDQVYTNGHAKIVYDDNDTWTGEAIYIYCLPPHHAGMNMKVAVGAPTMEGVPGMAPTQMAQPMMDPQMMMMQQQQQQQQMMMQQQQMQQQQMQQPGMQVLTAQCPPNGGPGMSITVQGPGGPMQVQVPQGVGPGMSFQFQVQAPPTVVAQPVMSQQPQVVMGVPM